MITLCEMPSWEKALTPIVQRYSQQLQSFLAQQIAQNTVYPSKKDWFYALQLTPLETVKVVILGQDPYHQPNQAHGLAFSVPYGVAIPPSLRNIYKALEYDLAIAQANHGCLTAWAKQGVLLLNTVLTVSAGAANSHKNQGWESITENIITIINEQRQDVVFLLWGKEAQKHAKRIDITRHKILQAPHPSPLSAHRGFFTCRHFSQCNTYLSEQGAQAIDWSLPAYHPLTELI